MQAEAKVLRGLKVTVEFDACSAEPDVGLMSDYVEDWHIVEVAGKPVKKADWIYKRLTQEDEDAILKACYAVMDDRKYGRECDE